MLRITTQLLERGSIHGMMFHDTPMLVPNVYKEHVEAYYGQHKLTSDQRLIWEQGAQWLRSLEEGMEHRLFSTPPAWASQLKVVVSRRATSRRMCLPLQDDIGPFVQALTPHLAVWILGLMDRKHLEVAMYPKILLQHACHRLRIVNFDALVQTCCDLYPSVVEKHMIDKDMLRQPRFPGYLSPWPGLRLCAPFYPELATTHLPPSQTMPQQGKYILLHATFPRTYGVASLLDAQTCMVKCLADDRITLPVKLSGKMEEHVVNALEGLDGMHPRSFHPLDPESPYACAAKALTPCVVADACETSHGDIVLPQNVLDRSEVGFPFAYQTPRNKSGAAWTKVEEFYHVPLTPPLLGQHTVAISAYAGWGLRLRHTLLTLYPLRKWSGQGLCLVLPDGVDQETEENLLLTCLGWVRDLGLRHTKMVSETQCQRMCLATMSQKQHWASIYDGFLGSHAVLSQHKTQRWDTSPLKPRLAECLRDHLLCHPDVKQAMLTLRFSERTVVLQTIRKQFQSILDTLTAHGKAGTIHLTLSPDISLPIHISETLVHQWLDDCVKYWTDQPWWTDLRTQLETCTGGVGVSGGLFDECPRMMQQFRARLGPLAQQTMVHHPLHHFHGACMTMYADYTSVCRMWDTASSKFLTLKLK